MGGSYWTILHWNLMWGALNWRVLQCCPRFSVENYKWPKLHDLPVVKMASFVLGMGKSSNIFFGKCLVLFIHTISGLFAFLSSIVCNLWLFTAFSIKFSFLHPQAFSITPFSFSYSLSAINLILIWINILSFFVFQEVIDTSGG